MAGSTNGHLAARVGRNTRKGQPPGPHCLSLSAREGVRYQSWNGTDTYWREVVRMSVVVAIICPEGAALACDSRATEVDGTIISDSRQKWAESPSSVSPPFIAAWTGALTCNKTSRGVEEIVGDVIKTSHADVESAAEKVGEALKNERDGNEGGTYVFIARPSSNEGQIELWYVEAPTQQKAATARRHCGCPCKDFRGVPDVRRSLNAHDPWLRCTPCAVGLTEAVDVCISAVRHVIDDTNVHGVGGTPKHLKVTV